MSFLNKAKEAIEEGAAEVKAKAVGLKDKAAETLTNAKDGVTENISVSNPFKGGKKVKK